MVLLLSCFRRIQFGAFGGKGVTEYSFYFCPRFQNDTGFEVWGFCVFYRQVAGIVFLPCCKWRSVSAHRSLTRLIHVSMYLCREIISTPLKNIGKALGNRDHTTVMHGIIIQVSQVCSTRPERAEAPSPGHRPGYNGNQQGAL